VADITDRALARANPLAATIRVRFRPLEGVRFGLLITMNSRSFRWFAHIFDVAGNPVAQSIAIVDRADLFAPFRASGVLPAGQLYCLDTTGAGEPPRGFGAWRERWLMRYRPEADVGMSTEPRVA